VEEQQQEEKKIGAAASGATGKRELLAVIYTIKTCHFVFDYNSGLISLVDFYTFCTNGKRKEYSTKRVDKIYHFTLTVSPH